jgi:hypothetical protein
LFFVFGAKKPIRGEDYGSVGSHKFSAAMYGARLAGAAQRPSAQRDRTLAELDTAIAATEATSKKADTLVQQKLALAQAAETRMTKLVAVLKSVCDDCATIPCLIPAAESKAKAACMVCGNSMAPYSYSGLAVACHVKPKPAPSASDLEMELASHVGSQHRRIPASQAQLRSALFQAPNRDQMVQKAQEFVTATKTELDQARKIKAECEQQKQTLQKEQKQLVARLGGLLEDPQGAKGAKRKASSESCSVCLSSSKTHVLIPCGHKCMCDKCAGGFRAGSQCPICRGRVQSVVRVFD